MGSAQVAQCGARWCGRVQCGDHGVPGGVGREEPGRQHWQCQVVLAVSRVPAVPGGIGSKHVGGARQHVSMQGMSGGGVECKVVWTARQWGA